MCPKDDGVMEPIPGFDEAWKCVVCGLEVWDVEVPTPKEYEELVTNRMVLQSASYKPYLSRSFVQLPSGASSSGSGRTAKKKKVKPDLEKRYHDKI